MADFEEYWKEEIDELIDNLMDGDCVEEYYPWLVKLANNEELRKKAINETFKDLFENGNGKFWCMISSELEEALSWTDTARELQKETNV